MVHLTLSIKFTHFKADIFFISTFHTKNGQNNHFEYWRIWHKLVRTNIKIFWNFYRFRKNHKFRKVRQKLVFSLCYKIWNKIFNQKVFHKNLVIDISINIGKGNCIYFTQDILHRSQLKLYLIILSWERNFWRI